MTIFDFDWLEDFDLFDIGLAGAMSEEMADEELNQKQIKEEDEEDDDVV